MRSLVYGLSLELIAGLREPLGRIRRQDAALARQGTNALNSVALNVAEANRRTLRDRRNRFRIALGSLREVGAVLDIAAAHGWLAAPPMAAERDRLGALLYGLQRR